VVSGPSSIAAYTFDEFLAGYGGLAKQTLLVLIKELPNEDECCSTLTSTRFDFFMKRENLILHRGQDGYEDDFDESSVVLKDPRMIATMTTPYLLALSIWVKRFAKLFAEMYRPFVDRESYFIYGGGMNAEAMGVLFTEALWRYGVPAFIEIDYTRFDRCVGVSALEYEFATYRACGVPDTWLRLLRLQLSTVGSHRKHKIQYSVPGTRKSGTANTSIGNTIINFGMARHYMELCGITRYTMFAMGDDNLIILNKADLPKNMCGLIVGEAAKFGFQAKPLVRDFYLSATFCSGRFWPVAGGGHVFGPKIMRILGKSFYQNADSHVDPRRYRELVEQSLYCNVGHVPVLNCLPLAGGLTEDPYRVRCSSRHEVSPVAYQDLCVAVDEVCGVGIDVPSLVEFGRKLSDGAHAAYFGPLVDILVSFDSIVD